MNKRYLVTGLWLVLLFLGGSSLLAQRTVTGTVRDTDGTPLIGVAVYPPGQEAAGTATNVDGNYTLTVPEGVTRLVFSYVGFTGQTIDLNNRTRVDVTLGENAEVLDEVVVIAYGEAKKDEIVGAVSQVTSRQIEDLQVNSFDQALAGQTPGLQIRTGSGRPDGGAELLLRGVGTSGDNAPLIVIDGIPYGNYNAQNNNFLSMINPNDIESISVVRDASGKALYGSRAGNGLIIIKTKRGREGKPTISVNYTTAVQTIPDFEKPNNLNAAELAQFLYEREIDNGVAPEDIPDNLQNPAAYGEGTDWYDAITRTGYRNQLDLSVRGGSENLGFALSAGYTGNQGVIKASDFERYTARLNVNGRVTPWLTFNTIIAPSQTISNVGGTDPGTGQFQAYHILQVARWADPSAPLRDSLGNLTTTTRGDLLPFFQANPLYKLENQVATQTNRQLQGQFELEAQLLPGLTLKQLGAIYFIFNRGRNFSPGSVVGQGLTPNNPDPPANSSASFGRYENLRLLSETTLNFNRSFGQHRISALAGYIIEDTQETFAGGGGSRLLNEDFQLFNSGNIATFLETDPSSTRIFFNSSEGEQEQGLISYIGRASYSFAKRYDVTASVRRDASSRFGPGNEAAIFPAIGLGWTISNENWFPQSEVLSRLKFEVSIGETGNNRIGNYAWQGDIGGANYILGEAPRQGRFVSDPPNRLLRWETVAQQDYIVEMGFFENRLDITATYYRQVTQDLLNRLPLPDITGFNGIDSNIGEIQNTGVELEINSKPIVRDGFVWTLGANFSANRNRVNRLGFENVPIFAVRAGNGTTITRTFVGEPVGQYYGLQILGLYTPELLEDPNTPRYPGAVPGAPYYLDGDGDGTLESQEDYVFLGNPFPDFNYGINSFITWKNFGLRIIGFGEQGSLIYDLAREIELNTDGVFNMRREVLNRFRPGSTDYTLRPPTTETVQSSQRYRWPNSLAVVDGSFFRISNISLSYKLNDLLTRRVPSIQGATVSFAVQNPFLFTPFYGNPETGRASSAFERNINYNTYPSTRTYTFGLQLSL